MLWDSEGRGYGRTENPASPISAKTLNSALDRAREACGFAFKVTCAPRQAHLLHELDTAA